MWILGGRAVYKAIYKCRLCGVIIEVNGISDNDVMERASICEQLLLTNKSSKVFSAMEEPEYILHYCGNGDYGIMDFQGFKKDDNQHENLESICEKAWANLTDEQKKDVINNWDIPTLSTTS
jgi:hypothetical protein